MPRFLALEAAARRRRRPGRRAGRAASAGGRRCRAAAAADTRPATGEHAVRLVDALGHQVVDQHADVGLAAVEDQRRLALELQRGVDAGHQPLGGGLLVAGRAVDLPGEVQARDPLRLQRRHAAASAGRSRTRRRSPSA